LETVDDEWMLQSKEELKKLARLLEAKVAELTSRRGRNFSKVAIGPKLSRLGVSL